MRNRIRAFAITGLSLLFATQAYAYVPPSQFLIKSMTKRKDGVKSIRVRSTITSFKSGKPAGVQLKQTLWVDLIGRSYRSQVSNLTGEALFSMERKLDQVTPAQGVATRLLVDGQYVSLARLLKNADIPIRTDLDLDPMPSETERRASEKTWISRWSGTVSWVIGEDPRKSAFAPQLWIEKDAFLVNRLIAKGVDGWDEVRFKGYRYYKEVPIARELWLIKQDPAKLQDFFAESLVNAVLKEELIDVSVNIESAMTGQPETLGYTEKGSDSDSETQELIRAYYGVIR